jgi:hypothetical protein
MLEFIKKLFGSKPTVAPVPYKVETPVAKSTPVPTPVKAVAKQKPAVKAKTSRKPRTP